MPPDLAIPANTLPPLAPTKPAAVTPDTASVDAAVAAASPHASPVSLLDPQTGLVVLEFYNASGQETASLPTRKQLELYRLNEPSPSVFEPAIHDVAAPAPAGTLPTHA